MKKTNLETIRQACIKANPEIMELKEDSKVEVADSVDFYTAPYIGDIGFIFNIKKRSKKWIQYEVGFGNGDWELFTKKELKVIPVFRLADVLFALGKKDVPGVFVSRFGEIEGKGNYQSGAKWDLKHDNLELQSEETLRFLSDLLGDSE